MSKCPKCGKQVKNSKDALCRHCAHQRDLAGVEYRAGKEERERKYAAALEYANRPDVKAAIAKCRRMW